MMNSSYSLGGCQRTFKIQTKDKQNDLIIVKVKKCPFCSCKRQYYKTIVDVTLEGSYNCATCKSSNVKTYKFIAPSLCGRVLI